MIASRVVDSPLGPITITATATGICGLDFGAYVQDKSRGSGQISRPDKYAIPAPAG